METNSRETTWAQGFLTGLVVGGVSAAALTVLYAPSSGREVRQYLSKRARDGREHAMAAVEKGKQIVSESRDTVDRGRELISTAIADGREVYRQTKARHVV